MKDDGESSNTGGQFPVGRERYADYMQAWDFGVRSQSERSWDAQKIAASFATIALQSAFLVNGGALIAIPPLMEWLGPQSRAMVPGYAKYFVIGLIVSALSSIMGYFNFMMVAAALEAGAKSRADEINSRYSGTPLAPDRQKTQAAAELWHSRKMRGTQVAALLLGLCSYLLFAYGSYMFIDLANASIRETREKSHTEAPHDVSRTENKSY